MNIALLKREAFEVCGLQAELDAHPELWDQHRARTEHARSPHRETSDIWVRFAALPLSPHPAPCEWYPAASHLRSARRIAERLAEEYHLPLAGVLLTRIAPGKRVYPHVDRGWHAESTEKLAVCVRGGAEQRFCFADTELVTQDGDLFWFDNSRAHWVVNDSAASRVTLIVCLISRRIN